MILRLHQSRSALQAGKSRAATLRSITIAAAFAAGLGLLAQTPSVSSRPAVPQASTQQSPFGGVVVEDVIARVNDQIISRSDYDRAEQDLEQRARQQNLSPQDVEAQRKDLLRDLVDQQLLLSKAKELDITGETELVRALNEIRKQNHLDTMEDLQKAAESQGVNYEDFKASIRDRIISQQVIRDEVGRHLNITEADVQRYYQQHKDEFNKPETVQLSEIMVPVADQASAATSEAKANDFEARLKSGADFDSLVKEASAGSANPQGGDLGAYTRGKLPKVIEDQTFSLKAGEFTAPIRTKQGFIILKVTQHIPGGQTTLKDVEPQVEDALAQEKIQPAVRAYLAQARLEAYIDYKPGYVDTAAVVNPGKPVYTAYVPPSPHKKKKTVRTRYRGRSRSTVQSAKGPAAAPENAPIQTASGPSLADVPHSDSAATPQSTSSAGATPGQSAEAATTASNAPADAPATGKTRESARKKPTQVAGNTMKAGKKEKIRFGQAPRETLPENDNTRNVDAHAAPAPDATAPETQVASNNADVPEETAPDAPKQEKKRYSARAKLPKPKKSTTTPVDPLAPPPETTEDTASRQTQAAPLGLAGDTAKPVKKKKVKPTEKTRLQNQPKAATPLAPPPDETAPVATTPPIGTPATPLDTNPVQTPPTNTPPVPSPGDGSTTPPQPPQ